MEKIFVCGAGHQGLAMAAHLALNGVRVTLWNRTEEHIKKIIQTKRIYCEGVVNGCAQIDKVSTNIKDVFSEVVMVTTPSSAHKDVARALAPFVTANTLIVLNPGRTFGAIEFAEVLKECGIKNLPCIAETQTIVYTCRRSGEDRASIYALKKQVKIATIKGFDINEVVDKLPHCLRNYFYPSNSLGWTSFANIGMILHCAPVLMNIGWIESDMAEFKYYYDGISPSISKFLEKMDSERMAIADACGYHVESVSEWMKNEYGTKGLSLYDCIRNNTSYREIDAPSSIKTRYIFEDVPNGLVPIEYLGNSLGLDTRCTSTIIDLACEVTDINFREVGRKYPVCKLRDYI